MRCSQPHCSVTLPPNTKVTLTAVLGDDSVFAGFHPYPMRPPAALQPWLGDPLAACLAGNAVDAAERGNVYDCAIAVESDTDVSAEFAKKPDAVAVAFTDTQLDEIIKPLTRPERPVPIDAEKPRSRQATAGRDRTAAAEDRAAEDPACRRRRRRRRSRPSNHRRT